MARLPGVLDLGATPRAEPGRPIGSYDVSGFARGGAAIAEGARQLGTGMGKLGEGVADLALDENRWDYAKAHSDFLSRKVELDETTAKDTNYGPDADGKAMPKRYEESLSELRDSSAALIRSGPMRERFNMDVAPMVAEGVKRIDAHARGLENNASVAYVQQQGENLMNKAVASTDDATKRELVDSHNQLVDGLIAKGAIQPTQAVAMKQAWAKQYTHADVLARIDGGDADGALADLRGSRGGDSGHFYDKLAPLERESLIQHAEQATHKKDVDQRADFHQREQDASAEALSTGNVTKPLAREEFTKVYGAAEGERRYQNYDTTVQTGRTIAAMADMTPEQRGRAVDSLKPVPGEPGFAVRDHAYGIAQQAAAKVEAAIKADPATFAVEKLPAAGEAWTRFTATANDVKATEADRAAAAGKYATAVQLEQERIGVPQEQQRIVPKAYVDRLAKVVSTAADSDDPGKRVGLVGQIQREAAIWGEHWPSVMRELAPTAQPIVRAIAAGADPVAMTRLLSLPKDESPAKVLKEQNETKFKDLTTALNDTMAPFRRSLVGRQLDRDYPAYYGLAEKLSALYVRDGKSPTDASAAAFKDLVGDRYEFRDTWRMPKSSGVDVDDVHKGVIEAKRMIREGGAGGSAFGIMPAANDIDLADPRGDSLAKFARDGVWVTAPDNSGLNLMYGDKAVRHQDGAPLLLPWSRLAELGKGYVKPEPTAKKMPSFSSLFNPIGTAEAAEPSMSLVNRFSPPKVSPSSDIDAKFTQEMQRIQDEGRVRREQTEREFSSEAERDRARAEEIDRMVDDALAKTGKHTPPPRPPKK